MSNKSWHIDRRTMLKGVGVAIGLPFLEAMGDDATSNEIVRRSCILYMGNGVGNPQKGQKGHSDGWRWLPETPGKDYSFGKSIEPYKPFQEKITLLSGLWNREAGKHHPHSTQSLWLTSGQAGGRYPKPISVDQAYAEVAQKHTRYSSLVLSCDEGIGPANRFTTLSHNGQGTPIPAIASPRKLFDQYFTAQSAEGKALTRQRFADKKKHVDLILEHAKHLKSNLGAYDRRKLDEYLQSLNEVEAKLKREEAWLDVPMKKVEASQYKLDVAGISDPETYYKVMFDLIVLALEMDLTRSVTFTLVGEQGSVGTTFPRALGMPDSHEITHNKTEDKFVMWGQYDRWMASNVAYLLEKLNAKQDHAGPLLDSTLVFNGSPAGTHAVNDNAFVLAGGKNLGFKHGRYLKLAQKPMANLYVTMLNRLGVPTEAFGDSDGELTEVLHA